MAYMLSELVQYTIARSTSHEEVVSRLMNAGFEVGRRAVEIVSFRCLSWLRSLLLCFTSSGVFMRFPFSMNLKKVMICRRDRAHVHTRAVTVLEIVKQVSGMLWPYLFNKQPDSLQRDDDVCAASSAILVSYYSYIAQIKGLRRTVPAERWYFLPD